MLEDVKMRNPLQGLIDFISESFIWGVGITRPRPGKERGAAIFITVLLVGSVVFAAAAFFLLKSVVLR